MTRYLHTILPGQKAWKGCLVAVGLLICAPRSHGQPSDLDVGLETLVAGLNRPVAITHAGDGSDRLFIASLTGRIYIFDGVQVLARPFLDLSSLVDCCGTQGGLLGFTFHPDYASNGFLYVNYTDTNGDVVMARYKVSAMDPNVVDETSAQILLGPLFHPNTSHYGNHLAFGPDGYLYVALGDGASPDDIDNNGQSLETLFGKVLRLDVDQIEAGASYAIPPDNPFIDDPVARDEIWAYGLP